MPKILTYLALLIFLLQPLMLFAQSATPEMETDILKREERRFLRYIHIVATDSIMVDNATNFVEPEVDSIHHSIMADTELSDAEKAKAIQSLVYFINALSGNIHAKKFEIYAIPAAFSSYRSVLAAVLNHSYVADILVPLSAERSRLLATSFRAYNEYGLLNDVAVYKAAVDSPAHILRFVEAHPQFRYADSLLMAATLHDPVQMVSYLQSDPALFENIRGRKNIYLKQITALVNDSSASRLIPFIVQLAEHRMTRETILENTSDPTIYFQLLVNTLREEVDSRPASSAFLLPLRNAVKRRSLALYVNPINALHGAADSIRFAPAKDLRIEDLYYVITSCEDELFTSSYLGLYKRLMQKFRDSTADSVFEVVQYDNFVPFMRLAANYNTLPELLTCVPPENAARILNKFISGIEADPDSGLEKAMDIADSFIGISGDSAICAMIENELRSNAQRCDSAKSYFGVRLYDVLLQVLELVKPADSTNQLWSYLGNHEELERKSLQDQNGNIVELVLFYGDEDGISSFKNFVNLFRDARRWKVSRNKHWVTIRSVRGQPISIYANLPLNEEQGLDLEAQDSLIAFLKQQSEEPVILVHRGHSYHVSQSLRRLQTSVKLAILGSCGGYNGMLSVANISPDAQIIISKKTGSKFINDPMIEMINETLQGNNDLVWNEIWERLEIRFSKDPVTLNLFNDYIPPRKNVSLFVLKLFNFSTLN